MPGQHVQIDRKLILSESFNKECRHALFTPVAYKAIQLVPPAHAHEGSMRYSLINVPDNFKQD